MSLVPNNFIFVYRKIFTFICYTLCKIFLLPILQLKFKIKYHNKKLFKDLKRPYILLGNHQVSWDPLLLNMGLSYPVHWVATDTLFRKKFLGRLLMGLGTIPKAKNMSDMETIQLIRHYSQKNGVIGLFAEGQQNWDGQGLAPVGGTAKLLRFLKVPVVYARNRGGYLSHPRWATKSSKRQIDIDFELVFSEDEIKKAKLGEIEQKLNELYDRDDYLDQKKDMIPIKGNHRAEFMELTLFLCPECKSIGSLKSNKNNLKCTSCSFEVHIDKYGFFNWNGKTEFFPLMKDWNIYQKEHLKKLVDNCDNEKAFWHDDGAILRTSVKRRPLKQVATGSIYFYPERIEFRAVKGDSITFEISDIVGANVFKQQYLEFHYNKRLYRIQFDSMRISSYKWLCMIEELNSRLVNSE